MGTAPAVDRDRPWLGRAVRAVRPPLSRQLPPLQRRPLPCRSHRRRVATTAASRAVAVAASRAVAVAAATTEASLAPTRGVSLRLGGAVNYGAQEAGTYGCDPAAPPSRYPHGRTLWPGPESASRPPLGDCGRPASAAAPSVAAVSDPRRRLRGSSGSRWDGGVLDRYHGVLLGRSLVVDFADDDRRLGGPGTPHSRRTPDRDRDDADRLSPARLHHCRRGLAAGARGRAATRGGGAAGRSRDPERASRAQNRGGSAEGGLPAPRSVRGGR